MPKRKNNRKKGLEFFIREVEKDEKIV